MDATIPNEVLFNILLKIENINDVMNMCATNTAIRAIWKHHFELDYPDISLEIIPNGLTYKQIYQSISSIGIGINLTNKYPENLNTITDLVNVGLTEIGGKHRYRLTADAAIQKVRDRWKFLYYPRDANDKERIEIFFTENRELG